ncbi:hypothetical protein IKW73_00625 [Candidatus Saccharibacteria bacterium]|nr:hypothetical protein [Candidatus Saccharibacteria bacterium]
MDNGIETVEEVMRAKKKFLELSESASLEDFKKEASKYFDEKEKKYEDAIDFGFDYTVIVVAGIMQKRIKVRRERMETATTPKEAYEGMFSPVDEN